MSFENVLNDSNLNNFFNDVIDSVNYKKQSLKDNEQYTILENDYEIIRDDILNKAIQRYNVFHTDATLIDINEILKDKKIMQSIDTLIKREFNIRYPKPHYLISKENNYNLIGKLSRKQKQKKYKSFNRFAEFYKHYTKLYDSLEYIDEVTDRIIERCPDPKNNDSFYYHVGVYGYPQIGKTTNHIGLTHKLIDVLFDIIIILSGTTNDTQWQTQLRYNYYCLGKNENEELVGIGNYYPYNLNKGVYDDKINYTEGETSIIVTKKNKSTLTKLLNKLRNIKKCYPDISIAIINDESDDSSINTHGTEEDPTVINNLVRQIRDIGKSNNTEKVAIFNYTATPFADIVIEKDEENPDLFPKDNIIILESPLSYLGPKEFYGENSYPFLNTKTICEYNIGNNYNTTIDIDQDIIKNINDESKNKNNKSKGKKKLCKKFKTLPDSLKESIKLFILNGALIQLRNEKDIWRNHNVLHHSMLINIDVNNDTQEEIMLLVKDYIEEIRTDILTGKLYKYKLEINTLYKYLKDRAKNIEYLDNKRFNGNLVYNYDYSFNNSQVEEAFEKYILSKDKFNDYKIKIKLINGKGKEKLDYSNSKEGLHVIAVGGLKLSRALTLENLTVSFFYRSYKTATADVLLQSSRWFGYRDQVRDLITVYTTNDLKIKFAESERMLDKLFQEFRQMSSSGKSPFHFKAYILRHKYVEPTSSKKRQHAIEYNEKALIDNTLIPIVKNCEAHSATFSLDRLDESNDKNFESLEILIKEITTSDNVEKKIDEKVDNNIVFQNVDPRIIIHFLEKVEISQKSDIYKKGQQKGYIQYIDYLIKENKLDNFRVMIFNNTFEKEKLQTPSTEIKGIGEIYTSNQCIDKVFVEDDNTYFEVNQGKAINYRHIRYVLNDSEKYEIEKATNRKYTDTNVPSIKKAMEILQKMNARVGFLLVYILNKNELTNTESISLKLKINDNLMTFGLLLPNGLDKYKIQKLKDEYGTDLIDLVENSDYKILLQDR